MIIRRLFGIVYVLLNKRTVTAQELAKRFEVSVRTIYRDMEMLESAGIPIYTKKGRGGGITLLDTFVLNKMLVTENEQQQILAALSSLAQVERKGYDSVQSRLADFFQIDHTNWVSIDFSDWGNQRQGMFAGVKQAILEHRILEFDYYGRDGKMEHRIVEPVQLWFKSRTWYLRARCRDKNAMRIFKMVRMKRVRLKEEYFEPAPEMYAEAFKPMTMPPEGPIKDWSEEIVLRIDQTQTYRIYDSFEEEEISEQEDGSFLVQVRYPVDEWVYGVILGFCPHVEIIKPVSLRDKIREIMTAALEKI